jgi:hypothetical protein
MDTSRFGH